MRKLLLAGAVLLALSACRDDTPPRYHPVRERVVVHHLRSGDYAYQDNSGLWWYLIMRGDQGTWTSSSLPPNLAGSSEVPMALSVNGAGSPAETVATVETEADGGGLSEANAGPTDASPSVGAEASAPAGGDAGGGGGDGGGGGGE